MKVYVCYLGLDDEHGFSEPQIVFDSENKAKEWVEKKWGSYKEMELE